MTGGFRDRLAESRDRYRELLEVSYPGRNWTPCDLAVPLATDLLELAREAIESLEACERVCLERGQALERARLI
jgi:hypothetical protein